MQNRAVLLELLAVVGADHDCRLVVEAQLANQIDELAEPRIDIVNLAVIEGFRVGDAVYASPALARDVLGNGLQVWCEEATLQGVTLWVGCKKDSQRMRVALRSLLLDAGLDPIRFDFPPLMDELRAQLDPEETMVIMEGEWSGS